MSLYDKAIEAIPSLKICDKSLLWISVIRQYCAQIWKDLNIACILVLQKVNMINVIVLTFGNQTFVFCEDSFYCLKITYIWPSRAFARGYFGLVYRIHTRSRDSDIRNNTWLSLFFGEEFKYYYSMCNWHFLRFWITRIIFITNQLNPSSPRILKLCSKISGFQQNNKKRDLGP